MEQTSQREIRAIDPTWDLAELMARLAKALVGDGPALALGSISVDGAPNRVALVVNTSGSTGVAKEVGLKEEISLITEEAMQGQLDFTDSFKKRLSILKGTNISIFESVYRDKVKFSPGAEELINYFKSNQIKKSPFISKGLFLFYL